VAEDGPQDGWFVGVNGVPLGPIPVGDLRELASAGHIDRKSLVWREGQAEWRPLGKFPFLARILDDGGAASAARPAPPEPSEAAAPPTARNSAANGETATGFDAGPVETRGDRPSAWGDLDEDEDVQEQPTTVKGRVSVPPPPQVLVAGRVSAPGAPPTALPGLPPVPPPPVPKVEVALAPGQGPASSTGAVSVPPSAAELGQAPVVSALPVGDDAEAKMLRGKGRNKTLLMALAAAVAIAVGAIAWHLLSASPAKHAAPPAHPLATTSEQEKKPEPAMPPPETPPPAETPPAAAETAPAEPPIAQVPESPPTVKSPPTVTPPASSAEPSPKPAPSLLSGLNTLQTPGPAPVKTPGAAAGTGPGLEATAIQRTVRKYSPAVRQNCWQRALNARAPGVPSSAKVTATITVDSSGHVQSVTATGAPRGYPGLAHCIEEAVKGWAFPRSLGETVTNVPFMFVGQ